MIPKFRAWLKKEQKMDNEIDHISWLEDELYCIGDGITYMVLAEDLVLMQSTGLKDKNGKEIFEGDIVELKDCGETLGNVKVYWDDLLALFQLYAVIVDEKEPMYKVIDDEDCSYIVVGNIYENPELLEVE